MDSRTHPFGVPRASRLVASCAAVFSLGTAMLSTPARADVLTFPANVCTGLAVCFDGSFIDASYGDVAGVVDVSYHNLQGGTQLTQLRYWNTDYNDLQGVAWTDGGDSDSRAEIFIQPLNGEAVTLHGFDLGAWFDSQLPSRFTILDGALNVLFESGPLTIGIQPDNLHNHFSFVNLSSSDGIRIQWGPSAFNVGIDNVEFTVGAATVPLPPAAALLGGGLLALLGRRRRAA